MLLSIAFPASTLTPDATICAPFKNSLSPSVTEAPSCILTESPSNFCSALNCSAVSVAAIDGLAPTRLSIPVKFKPVKSVETCNFKLSPRPTSVPLVALLESATPSPATTRCPPPSIVSCVEFELMIN